MDTRHLVLSEGEDLQKSLHNYLKEENISKAVIVSCIGVLRSLYLSFDGESPEPYEEYYGIAQMSGIVENGEDHLHLTLFAEKGEYLIGHLHKEAIIEDQTDIIIGILN